jgi:threonine dehydrogenase-like Zn-dependent dehydrogenase
MARNLEAVSDARRDRNARSARALWYVGAGRAEIRSETLPPARAGDVEVETLWTGLSRGTERLVFRGEVPDCVAERMRAPAQDGSFPFPVKYGYCAVGRVAATGETVFALRPHQTVFTAPREALWRVPDAVPARRAVLAANMETALNALWDSGAGPGDRIAIVGAGIVGLLVASLAARLPGAEVVAVDPDPSRGPIADALGVAWAADALGVAWAAETPAEGWADVVLHASATQQGLASALSLAGQEARIVELSWHGGEPVSVPLGGAFHARRLAIVGSQVGEVSPSRRPRWSRRRRMAKALELLADPRLDALITEEVAFDVLPEALPRLLAPGAPGLCTAIRYERG